MVQPSTSNRTEPGSQEWRDFLFLRYVLDPPYLPKFYHGCNNTFSICHALDCNKGGLLTSHHNKICDGVVDLAGKYFTTLQVCNDPLIFAGRAVKIPKYQPDEYKPSPSTKKSQATEHKGDPLIRDLWKNGDESFHDMCVVNTDAKSYLTKKLERFIQDAAKAKESIYLEACLYQRRHFSPFVDSIGWLMYVEVEATLKRIYRLLVTNWHQPYQRICGYIQSNIFITLVRSTHQCIKGSRVPAHRISVKQPQWEDGAGSSHFRQARREKPKISKNSCNSTQQELWAWRPKQTK